METEAQVQGVDGVVIRGGAHDALEYRVPVARLEAVDPDTHDVVTDLDVTDFLPRLRDDGVVELVLLR